MAVNMWQQLPAEPQQLFQNAATVTGVVSRGDSTSDSFSACQRGFSSKNSPGSYRRVRRECHDIPGSREFEIGRKRVTDCPRTWTPLSSTVQSRSGPKWPRKKSLAGRRFQSDFEVMQAKKAWLSALGNKFFQDGIKKRVYRGISVSICKAIMWKSYSGVDCNPENVIRWSDVTAVRNKFIKVNSLIRRHIFPCYY
jgi:hypothetical protein